jgi:peptidoglycan/LPS O-acetylase OafA/YrhL
MLLYFAFREHGQRVWLKGDPAVFAALVATLVCLHIGAPDLVIILLFVALVLLAVSNTGIFAKLVNIGPLVWLGEISYSLYLVHGLIQFAATKSLGALGIQHTAALSSGLSLALMMLMLALCIFCASATYSDIEIVWRRHLRTLLAGPPEVPSPQSLGSQQA